MVNKKVFKDAVKAVRREQKWKRPTKGMLQEACKRYLDQPENQKRLNALLRGIG